MSISLLQIFYLQGKKKNQETAYLKISYIITIDTPMCNNQMKLATNNGNYTNSNTVLFPSLPA